jgi:hypothetical protein
VGRLRDLYGRGAYIVRTEGYGRLVKDGFDFLSRRIFVCETYYLHEHSLRELSEAAFMPRFSDFEVYVISNLSQVQELASRGLDPRDFSADTLARLEKGAVALCVVVNGELAHVGWFAKTLEAKEACDKLPLRIDFKGGQCWTGGTRTLSKFEGKGLMTYGYFKRFQLLREMGMKTSRNAVKVDNTASLKVHAKFGPKIYAKARYLRILGFRYWKETPTPIEETTN